MNKYDDIKTFLFTNFDINQSCEFLFTYLKNYCFKPYNREKIDSYYNNLSEILKRLLFFSNEGNLPPINPKLSNQSFIQVLNSKNSKFEEFDILLNLFLIPHSDQEINLFSSIFIQNFGNTKFLFPIGNNNKMILNSLNQREYDKILNSFNIFDLLTYKKDEMIKFLERKELILTTREYYIFTILNFIKNSPNFNKIKIKDYYVNYKKYFENISKEKFFCKKTEFILNNFDKERSIMYNFYNILILDFILNLANFPNVHNLRILEIFIFAVEFLWLGDFLLLPKNYFLTNNFFSKKNNPNNFVLENTGNLLTFPIPNLIVLNSLKNLIIILQSKNFLFTENNIEKKYILRQNVLLFNLQESLYLFFKNGFSKFHNDGNNTEISLSDFASVWYTYITPWESNYSHSDNYNNYTNLTNSSGSFSKNKFSPMKLKISKNNIGEYIEYVESNLHFYTDLFQDYINAFSTWNILSIEELSLLMKVLDIFHISTNGFFICELINYRLLYDFSNFSRSGIVENFIRYNPHLKRSIFPFDHTENIQHIKNLIRNIYNLIQKLSTSDEYTIEDSNQYIILLQNTLNNLKRLYNIDDNELEINELNNSPNKDNRRNVYDNRMFLSSQWGPWESKITSEESKILFYILYKFSYLIDYLRNIPIKYNKNGQRVSPYTNMRYLCNYYNLLSMIILIVVFVLLIRIIFLYLI